MVFGSKGAKLVISVLDDAVDRGADNDNTSPGLITPGAPRVVMNRTRRLPPGIAMDRAAHTNR
jgi:hypothetical protein